MSVLTCIGNTPLVELQSFKVQGGVQLFGKYEGCNPGGSIKDRTALSMIENAEKSGALTRDKTILEPSNGGIGIRLKTARSKFKNTPNLSTSEEKGILIRQIKLKKIEVRVEGGVIYPIADIILPTNPFPLLRTAIVGDNAGEIFDTSN